MYFRGGELEGGVWGGAIVAVCVCEERGGTVYGGVDGVNACQPDSILSLVRTAGGLHLALRALPV